MRFFITFLLTLTFLGSIASQETSQTKIMIPYRDGKDWGFCDTLGNISIKPQFDSVGFYTDIYDKRDGSNRPPVVATVVKNQKKGLVDIAGTPIIPIQFDAINLYLYHQKSIILVTKSNKMGAYIKSKNIIPVDFDQVQIEGEFFLVKKNGLFGLYDLTGKNIVPIQFDEVSLAYFYSYQVFKVKKGNKFGLFDQTGKLIIPVQYETIEYQKYKKRSGNNISGTTSLIGFFTTKNGKDYYYGLDGQMKAFNKSEWVVSELYDEEAIMAGETTYNDQTDMVVVSDKSIDQLKEDLKVDEIKPFSPDYKDILLIKKDGYYGLINSNSTEIIPPAYDSIKYINLNKHIFFVKKNQKWGIVNSKNEIQLPTEYDQLNIGRNDSNHIVTQKVGLKGCFIIYTWIDLFSPIDIYESSHTGFYTGYKHYSPIPPRYQDITFARYFRVHQNWSFNVFKVLKDNKQGYIGENGVEYFKN
jgi:WG containing repeat